ncbi:MAG: alpha/beta fold hydrolase [Planctomycetaceae bacterium]
MVNIRIKTLGGRQFWGDVRYCHGWRIQQNVMSRHCRLLDVFDVRHASGSLQDCRTALDAVRGTLQLPRMTGRAVVLIHGIGRSSKCFHAMARKLRQTYAHVIGFDYPSTRIPIEESVDYLRQVLESLEDVDAIDVVCHSMGGLLLRAFLGAHSEGRFHRAVMLGVPNQGAQLADFLRNNPVFRLLFGPAGQQLVTDPTGLIAQLPAPTFEFGILAGGRGDRIGFNPLLPGDNDSTVTVESAQLKGAADSVLLPVIHAFLMSSPTAVEATQRFLETGRFRDS